MAGNLVKKFQNFVFKKQLFKKGDGVVVGISGGADSVCLARVVCLLKDKYDLKIRLVHVNYGLRGADSEADENFVIKLAKELGVELKVYSYGKRKIKGNLEEQLREYRYEIFEKERLASGSDWIAVAHTLDDQVETFFMNLIRGSGARGLAGMKAKSGRIIRPLVIFEKKEILDYLKSVGQAYRLDKTNLEVNLLRNKVRHKLIPLFKEFNPLIKKRISALMEIIGSEADLIERDGNKFYNEVVKKSKGGLLELDVQGYEKSPLAMRRIIFRKIILSLRGDLKDLGLSNFDEFEKILFSSKNKRQRMSIGRIAMERSGDKAVIKNIKQDL